LKLKIKAKYLLTSLVLIGLTATDIIAQGNMNYQIGNSLIQQQRFEGALEIFSDLSEEQPQQFIFKEKLVDCLIELKRYDEAIQQLEEYNRMYATGGTGDIKLAEVYHIQGDTARAYTTWDQTLRKYERSLQVYIQTAQSLNDRREFRRAIDLYLKGRRIFNNNQLFFLDLANAYMQAGDYESSIREYLQYIRQNPTQMRLFQRTLMRYNDSYMYDIAILEFEEALDELPIAHPAYGSLHEVLIWMLQENKLYRRALATATRYEKQSSTVTFSLFNLGKDLVQNEEFELATRAFEYYVDTGYDDLRWRSMEELADVHFRWARFLDNYGLSFDNKSDSLYQRSFELYEQIQVESGNYGRLDRVFIRLAELSLDYLYEPDRASEFRASLEEIAGDTQQAEIYYLRGRIALFNRDYNEARLMLTRSNRAVRIGELAEKTRYYLAMTDFFEEDFEFAEIQLKSLGRQNTSIYANDALKLRLLIQKTKNADSLTASRFTDSIEKLYQGQNEAAATEFYEQLDSGQSVFADDILVQLSELSSPAQISRLFTAFETFISSGQPSPIRERLFWERARLGEYLSEHSAESELDAGRLYEELILEYPQGFYATYARQRLSNLSYKSL
jgi:hypothetical protein